MSYSPESSSAATPASSSVVGSPLGLAASVRPRLRAIATRLPHPEFGALIALAAVLDLWALSRNGWANDYYSAAVRSMSSSWHNFLYASADPSGVMSVDKPPLALWVQSLSVRVFGYHPLSVLVPQALMGIASVALVYDLVRRRFGRLGGFVAGLVLALTPITVAISRHNNPDALLVLCCVAALWFTVRALEDGRTRWLVLAGVCVGLGFETKMLIALAVVPAIAAAYLLIAPRGRLRALRQLLAGGAALLLVGGAWPALVALTPAADRPWISGTSDNGILSLIFEYNGLGRVDGQAGGPGGLGGGNVFGGSTGPLRLLNSALGGQAGWLLGFAIVSVVGLLAITRLRRLDARSGWLVLVGGTFLTIAAVFSAASGIFHPYYVSLLAPFGAALAGAGAAQMLGARVGSRVLAPLLLAGGVASELAVLHQYPGQLGWLVPVLIAVCALAAIALVALRSRRTRVLATAAALAALLLAPSVWAFDTLGHATSGTFPEGGPANAQTRGGGMFGAPAFALGGNARARVGAPGGVRLFGNASPSSQPIGAPSGSNAAPGGAGGFGSPIGNDASTKQVLAYVKAHGGGTIAVSSQSSAATAIVASGAKIAGIGGFSGRESDVSVVWLAGEVRAGSIRWVLAEQSGGQARGGGGLPGDTRAGSKAAMAAVAKACRKVTLTTGSTATAAGAGGVAQGFAGAGTSGSAASSLYDCQGRAGALANA
jgi:4-amino-4-deoxy-L-arabinose transferase-like glycosyltransferase